MAFILNLIKAFLLLSVAKCAIPNEDVELDTPFSLMPTVDMINNDPAAGWTAGLTKRFINTTMRAFRSMGGLILPEDVPSPLTQSPQELKAILKPFPASFDARTNWNCSSMWRILAVQVLQDRLCVQFGLDARLSPNDVLTCCRRCGNCLSGYLEGAYDYLQQDGAVTEECSPYFNTTACPWTGCRAPACKGACEDHTDYNKRYFTLRRRYVRGINNIMQEIMTKGPVSAGLTAFEDFITYKSGVYRYRKGKLMVGHAVKLVGWGTTSKGEDYWIGTNQWTSDWGENGHFRIRGGVNECNIERWVITADAREPQTSMVADV